MPDTAHEIRMARMTWRLIKVRKDTCIKARFAQVDFLSQFKNRQKLKQKTVDGPQVFRWVRVVNYVNTCAANYEYICSKGVDILG